MIRKMRWIFWGAVGSIPFYRNTYWDFLGRRVAWRDHLGFWGTEEEKKEKAEKDRADWGYVQRYEPVYEFSLKGRKYETQTDMERLNDTPRLRTTGRIWEGQYDRMHPKDVKTLTTIL